MFFDIPDFTDKKCQECGKQATCGFVIIKGKVKKEIYLCKKCAEKKGFEDPFTDLFPGPKSASGIPALLGEVIEDLIKKKGGFLGQKSSLDTTVCPGCGKTLRQIQMGEVRPGCGQCYRTFRKVFVQILEKIHGSTKHVGKRPGQVKLKAKSSVSPEIKPMDFMEEKRKLEAELEKAVQAEEFEKAARLRDKIKEIDLALTKSQIKATG